MASANENTGPGSPKTAEDLLDMYYLPMRSALMEVAAGLDRVQRAGQGRLPGDERLTKLREACRIMAGAEGGRAEKFQLLLSEDGGAGAA